MNYQILFDYHSEGFKFYDENKKFETIDEAVRFAVGLNYATPFLIVEVVWKP